MRSPEEVRVPVRSGRLALFLPALLGGGAERTMLNLAHGFVERGIAVDLLLARSAGPYLAQVSDRVRVIDLTAGSSVRKHHTLRCLPALVRYLRTDPPDGLLSSMAPANLVAVIARRIAGYEKRLVLNEQNTLSVQASNSGRWLVRLSPRLARLLYPMAYRVVGVSGGVVADLVQTIGINRDKVEVIYNPGITAELKRKARADLEHPWFAAGEPPVIVAVGSLTEQKDFSTLLQAFSLLRTRQRARLVILGEGRLRTLLEAQIAELGLNEDVSLPGFVDNPYPYMARAGVFVLSSRWEGLPTVLVEAMCCGAPLVATDCPSGPREILQDGALGALVPVGHTGKLRDAMLAALDGTGPAVGADTLHLYDIDTIIDQYADLLLP